MLDFLPYDLKTEISNTFKTVLEVRIRENKPITVKGFLNGEFQQKTLLTVTDKSVIEKIILNLSSFSVYSVEDSLKRGFITSPSGERVGICGECVTSNGENQTFKNFTSLCVRIPNDIVGCSDDFFKRYSKVKSCLVFSPPFHGKTTFIRDLARTYSNKYGKEVLFIDERDELSAGGKFNLGKNSDVIRYSTKKFGFYSGIRNLNPSVIVCDEIMTEEDGKAIEFASLSGVNVVASCHSDKIENLVKKENISMILKKNIFDLLIELQNGKIKNIYEREEWLNYL